MNIVIIFNIYYTICCNILKYDRYCHENMMSKNNNYFICGKIILKSVD